MIAAVGFGDYAGGCDCGDVGAGRAGLDTGAEGIGRVGGSESDQRGTFCCGCCGAWSWLWLLLLEELLLLLLLLLRLRRDVVGAPSKGAVLVVRVVGLIEAGGADALSGERRWT